MVIEISRLFDGYITRVPLIIILVKEEKENIVIIDNNKKYLIFISL